MISSQFPHSSKKMTPPPRRDGGPFLQGPSSSPSSVSSCLVFLVLIVISGFIIPSVNTDDISSQSVASSLPPADGSAGMQKDVLCQPGGGIGIGCLSQEGIQSMIQSCPDLSPKILNHHYPRGQKAAGDYTELPEIKTPEDCAKSCCGISKCHYVFVINATCFLLNCVHGEYLCSPTMSAEMTKSGQAFSMVLVRHPRQNNVSGKTCEVGLDPTTCNAHQKCIPTNRRSRNGVCVCEQGFQLEGSDCVEDTEALRAISASPSSSTATPLPSPLTVSVTSKNVTLPTNEVNLVAYVVPQAPEGHPYAYKWMLISNPTDDSAAVEGQSTDTLRLTGLKEGKYVFQVEVTTTGVDKSVPNSNGTANTTIFVFPEQKPNQPPVAVISPQDQSIQLPTSSAVLDASLSTDDDKIISYKWELQKGPILFALSPTKPLNSSTLQVENLIPGNYTFKLTVEDSQHVTNSTTANFTVIKEPDYPPTANPGKDIVIYLPQTEVTLNGNASTDDKKIAEWEWKATGEQTKAIDMQDTHTPYLKLSHLQVGLYQFELKVTDEGGQFSTATVHVVVKEPTGNPPTADAGEDQTTVLNKQNWVILDASKSKSDSKIVHYNWTQLSGPNTAVITAVENNVKANVSGLTKGEYEFSLVVEDDSKLLANDSVKVNVIQRVNEAPHSHAGGNQNLRLPLSIATLNGSASTDDVKIVAWLWERQAESLVAGIVLDNSDKTPILEITDLTAGKYAFKLTVKDEQGASDSDTVVLNIEEETREKDMIEVILGVPLTKLTKSDTDKVIQQLTFLLHDTKLKVSKIRPQLYSGYAVVQIYGEDKAGKVINGSSVASELKSHVFQDASLFHIPVYSIDTTLCLDSCSGHGTCQDNYDGRVCACDAFWMENFLKRGFGSRERNCDWSKIYVGVVVSLLLAILFAIVWSISLIFKRNFKSIKDNLTSTSSSPLRSNGKRYHPSKKHYKLVGEEELELRDHEDMEDAESEDSDSDILFETKKRSKNGSILMQPLANGSRNGILKNSRRVKT